MAAQHILLNQMRAESNRVLVGVFGNLKTAFDSALEKMSYDLIMTSERSTITIVHKIVEVAQEITDALVSLDKKTVENRYFDEMSLHIPVFQRLFSYANSEFSSQHLKESFSQYLRQNKHYFYVAREAITHAIIGKPDSYLRAQMNGYMTSGCTYEYNDQVSKTRAMLMNLHASTYIMESWDLDYRMKKARSSTYEVYPQVAAIREEMNILNDRSSIESRSFRMERDSSCPTFTLSELVGGGCSEGFVYPGQVIRNMECAKGETHLVLRSTGEVIKELLCQDNGEWDVNTDDLTCVRSCLNDGIEYSIGEARTLPSPQNGFHWVSLDGVVVTESLCQYNTDIDKAEWSYYKEEDIDECVAEINICGPNGSCVNTLGSYKCDCQTGYVFDPGFGCQDENECATGGKGAISCLVSQQLGVCINIVGGYRCSCLSGAYTTSPSECKACQCDAEGVITTSHCDGKTGECLCKSKVRGDDCSVCEGKYTNFPHCNKCAPGFFNYPNCKKCSCNTIGTTSDICEPQKGRCLCAPFANGRRCGRCCPGWGCESAYEKFPDCTPIVNNGTLSAWGMWSKWRDLGRCDSSGRKGFHQERKRFRTCDDRTKNRHGSSCKNDVLEDKEERFYEICKPVTGYGMETICKTHAGTTGKIKFKVKQDGIECESQRKTIDSPKKCEKYNVEGDFGCTVRFDPTKPLEIRALSDSGDDAKINYFYVKIGDKKFYWRGTEMKLHKNEEENPWKVAKVED